jgi:hypothetical protein
MGLDNSYSLKGLGSGVAKFYGINENDRLVADKSGERMFKYRVQVRHKWEVNKDTTMMAEFNKLRDQNFIKDYFEKEYDEQEAPDNYISFITAKRDYTTTFLVRKRMDKYYTVVERLPEFTMDIHNYKVGDTQFYYKSVTSAVYLNKTFSAIDNPGLKDVNTARVDSYNQLSYAAKLLGFWNTTPYAGVRQTYYSRNKWGDTNLVRGIFNAGVDNYMRFFKTYDVESDAFGMEIHKLRHIITPSANYYFTYQPTVSPDNLNQFDEIDALDTANGVKLSLENKLQTKRYSGNELKSVDLATFIVSSDYMFRLKDDNLAYKSQKFRTVDFQLELNPYPWLYNLSKMSVNTKTCTVETASVDVSATGGEKWLFGLGYRYEDVESGITNYATTEVMYKINEKWKVRVYEQYDIENGSFYEQEYTIFRDLHCWLVEFTYSIRANNDHTFWFALRLKAFPNIPIGMNRTYSRAQPGAAAQGGGASY